ncbi:hypothetical protein OH799_05620 [Nocardia sp. NBC_00881]|uniref:hypothetical protein n=1 Tax=Nocardia sp. NBC_00881 TaxID=2975995 RepID=UPI00386E4BC0|nr:hypothetical protein OH799_05620 [Nocardia sp. NBC_00881]
MKPYEDETLRGLTEVVLGELAAGEVRRGGPLPAGSPAAVKVCVTGRVGSVLPQVGIGAEVALRELTRALVLGSADPAEAWCVGHFAAFTKAATISRRCWTSSPTSPVEGRMC